MVEEVNPSRTNDNDEDKKEAPSSKTEKAEEAAALTGSTASSSDSPKKKEVAGSEAKSSIKKKKSEDVDNVIAAGLQHKDEGNQFMTQRDWSKAIDSYNKAIECDPKNHIYYSNRCAAFMKRGDKDRALKDAQKCVELAPEWPKSYLRLGHSLLNLNKLDEAKEAIEKGLSCISKTTKKTASGGGQSNGTSGHETGLKAVLREINEKTEGKEEPGVFFKTERKMAWSDTPRIGWI